MNNSGKLLISTAALMTPIAAILADWNKSHIFSPQWSPHSRFHGVVSLGMASILSPVALWLVWQRSADREPLVATAALIPIAYWGSFFPAALVPGTGVDDPEHRVRRIGGLPVNLLAAGGATLCSALGWYLDRRERKVGTLW